MIVSTAVDGYVDQNRPSANFRKAGKLWLNGGAGSDARHAYIFFARPFPLGATVEEAILRLHLAEAWGSSQTVTASRIVEAWQESRLNWNNRPGINTLHEATVNVASLSAGDEIELDLTEMMGDVSAAAVWFGVRLSLSTDSNRAIVSSDHPTAALRPVLEVLFSDAPEAPTSLAPGGGRAISKTKPILTWSDDEGGQSSSQVQVSTSTDFSSPSYDSGKVANTLASWDLSATAFSALAADAVRYWRVKVWDDTDLESEWSEAQEFTRKAHGTLAITNPDAAPDNQVEETTPPISWSFTDRTQEAFSLELYRVEAGGSLTPLASQAKVVSTETEWEVPAGIIRTGDTYRARLRVFDTIDRQAMAGDPDYVEATIDFTYVRAGTPAAVTALTATPDGARVVLAFTRTTEPDYFAIRRDGVEVLDRVEPSAVFVSGDDYSLDFWEAKPRVEHTYEVEAVVDDAGVLKHSDGNATADATTNPIGIWLADSSDSLAVFIAGKEKASSGIGEVGNRFDPVGSRVPVKITDAIQGFEGTQAGILTDFDGLTAAEWEERFLELYGRQTTLRLIMGNRNIPVEIGPVSSLPSSSGDRSFDVSFEFAQIAELDETFEVSGA